MFVKNVFDPVEQKAMDEWRARSEALSGWLGDIPDIDHPYPVRFRTAEMEIIRHQAFAADFKNLLYRDEAYAKKSKWGGIIAHPFFCKVVAHSCPFHFYAMPPSVARCERATLSEGLRLFEPIRPGDTFRVWIAPATIEDVTDEPGEQPCRKIRTYEYVNYYNQNDKLVATVYRDNTNSYTDPNADFSKILKCGYEWSAAMGGDEHLGEVRKSKEFVYTPEQIAAIDKVYANETRRGNVARYWEGVEPGETLPVVVHGPITVWDSFTAIAAFGGVPMPMMEIRTRTPFEVLVDPNTNIPHKSIEGHFAGSALDGTKWYSHTVIENFIYYFCGRLASNWMGDDGYITHLLWSKMNNTHLGDTVFGRGRVLRKYIDGLGRCVVDIDTGMQSNRGFFTNSCPVTVELPSITKMTKGVLPEAPEQKEIDLNPEGLKVGDHVKVKDWPDWELPGGYPLADQPGVICDMHNVDGYCFVLMDNDVTGHDPRVPVGFRFTDIEKI